MESLQEKRRRAGHHFSPGSGAEYRFCSWEVIQLGQSLRSMRPIMARRIHAALDPGSASESLVRRRHFVSQLNVRSTIQRFGSGTRCSARPAWARSIAGGPTPRRLSPPAESAKMISKRSYLSHAPLPEPLAAPEGARGVDQSRVALHRVEDVYCSWRSLLRADPRDRCARSDSFG